MTNLETSSSIYATSPVHTHTSTRVLFVAAGLL